MKTLDQLFQDLQEAVDQGNSHRIAEVEAEIAEEQYIEYMEVTGGHESWESWESYFDTRDGDKFPLMPTTATS